MSDVTIKYKGQSIATMDASGSTTLNTQGKYCEGDIGVEYVKPAGPSGTKQISITANGTTTEDVAAYANAEITVDVQCSGGSSVLSGEYTPESDTTNFSIDVGESFSDFAILELNAASGYGFRALRVAVCHFSTGENFVVSTNNTGTSVALELNYVSGAFTKSGNTVIYNKSNVKAPGGLTYKWFAW